MKILPTSYVQRAVKKPTSTLKQIVTNTAPTIRKALFVPLVAASTALITPSCKYMLPTSGQLIRVDENLGNNVRNYINENYSDDFNKNFSNDYKDLYIDNRTPNPSAFFEEYKIDTLSNGNLSILLGIDCPVLTEGSEQDFIYTEKYLITSKDGKVLNLEEIEGHDKTNNNIKYWNKYSKEYLAEQNRQELEKARIEAEQQRIEAEKKFFNDILEIPLFEDLKNTDYLKFFKAVGVSNFEYTKNPNGVYNIFVDKGGYNYDISLKQVDNTTSYAGLAKKLLRDGTSEIYIFKTDFFSTNKSDKFRISQMRVVQDGISDDAPIQKKNIKQTIKTGNNTTEVGSDYKGQKKVDMLLPLIPNIFYPGSHTNGNVSVKAINTINEIMTEMNCEGKIVTVYSSPKGSNRIERNGVSI